MALALQGFGDGAVKVTCMDGVKGERKRLYLPRCQWFEMLLKDHGLDSLLSSHGPQPGQAAAAIDAVVFVKSGRLIHGRNTPLHEEERLLWELFGRPKFAWSLEVTQVFDLQRAQVPPAATALVQMTRRRRTCWQHASASKHFVFRSAVPLVLPIQEFQTQLQLHAHAHLPEGHALDMDTVFVLWFPQALLQLVLRGAWTHVVIPLHWQSCSDLASVMGWPSADWMQEQWEQRRCLVEPEHSLGPISGRTIRNAADSLRRLASEIGAKDELTETVALLDGLAHDFGDSYAARSHDQEKLVLTTNVVLMP